jgi:hypothetical protein
MWVFKAERLLSEKSALSVAVPWSSTAASDKGKH